MDCVRRLLCMDVQLDTTPSALVAKAEVGNGPLATVRLLAGCKDDQQSVDAFDATKFKLPEYLTDGKTKEGGAMTHALLSVMSDAKSKEMTWVDLLDGVRKVLKRDGYKQVAQLTSTYPIELQHQLWSLMNPTAKATSKRRAVLIGINYTGHGDSELHGCQNDARNMSEFLLTQGFHKSEIVMLLDDGVATSPTRANMTKAMDDLVAGAQPGDSLFLHFSGHGVTVAESLQSDDDVPDEVDHLDEAIVPLDTAQNGWILDDELYQRLVAPLSSGVQLTVVLDSCHSGTALDLGWQVFPTSDSTKWTKMTQSKATKLSAALKKK